MKVNGKMVIEMGEVEWHGQMEGYMLEIGLIMIVKVEEILNIFLVWNMKDNGKKICLMDKVLWEIS